MRWRERMERGGWRTGSRHLGTGTWGPRRTAERRAGRKVKTRKEIEDGRRKLLRKIELETSTWTFFRENYVNTFYPSRSWKWDIIFSARWRHIRGGAPPFLRQDLHPPQADGNWEEQIHTLLNFELSQIRKSSQRSDSRLNGSNGEVTRKASQAEEGQPGRRQSEVNTDFQFSMLKASLDYDTEVQKPDANQTFTEAKQVIFSFRFLGPTCLSMW